MVPLLALLSSIAFASSNVSALRGTVRADPRQGVRLTILLGVPIFILMAIGFGQLQRATELPLLGWALFATAGVIHFVGGRTFGYMATREVGASRATVITTISPIVSIAIAVVLFGDQITLPIVAGGALVILGPLLISQGDSRSRSRGGGTGPAPLSPSRVRRGIMFGLAAGLCWGISPILIKAALGQASLPVLGTLISYTAASAVMGASLLSPDVRKRLLAMDPAGAKWYALAGVFVSMAQFLRYLALSAGSVTIVVLLMQVVPIFVITFSYLVNRQLETVNRYVVAGGALVTVGAIVIAFR